MLRRNYREPALQFFPQIGLFPRLILRTFLGTIIFYYLIVGVTAYSIYHAQADTRWNRAVNRIFPFPAGFVGDTVIPLDRVRLQTAALQAHNAKNNIPSLYRDTQQFVLDQISNRVLYKQVLSQNGMSISQKDIDQQMQNIYKDTGGESNFAQFLKDDYGNNLTTQQFKDWIVTGSLQEAAVSQQILVRVTIRHILIAVPDGASADQIEAARTKLLGIRDKITTPDVFGDIAKQYSEDIASRDKGGELGTTVKGLVTSKYSADFENAIFTMAPGEISQPIRTPYGWHLVQVEKKEGKVDLSLADYTQQLRNQTKIHYFLH